MWNEALAMFLHTNNDYLNVCAESNNPQQGQENRDPLPNPWSGNETNTSQSAPAGTPSLGNTMQGLMAQMMENPQLMQNMMNAPYTQSMMEALAADPNLASGIMSNNPLLADNPALQVLMDGVFLILFYNKYIFKESMVIAPDLFNTEDYVFPVTRKFS